MRSACEKEESGRLKWIMLGAAIVVAGALLAFLIWSVFLSDGEEGEDGYTDAAAGAPAESRGAAYDTMKKSPKNTAEHISWKTATENT